ncbi:MAG: hypothetical protein AAB870_00500 [Patescibacteria group bacterium]
MSELTKQDLVDALAVQKEYFDGALSAQKDDLKGYIDNALIKQTTELKGYADEKQSELATMVQAGFEGERKRFDEKILKLEIDAKQIKEALHLTK